MAYEEIEDLSKVTRNRYEAVIVAAQHARYLNSKRLAKLQLLEEGTATVDIDSRKMPALALRELMEGKVSFERTDTE